MPLVRVKIGMLVLGLAGLSSLRVAMAQKTTTTSQPSPPASLEAGELTNRPRASNSPVPDSVAMRQHLRQAAALQATYKDSEALAQYQEALKLNARNYVGLWRASVLSVSIGNRYSDETRKKAYFSAARDYANRAVAVHPLGGESNYALALALFSEAGLLSARDRLRIFKELRTPVFLAVQYRPNLPEAWQLLGRWHYRVAHYNVLEKTFSRIVLGGYPQGATTKKAIEALEKARQLDSTRIQYCYDLARMYKYEGQRRRAIRVLQGAIKLPTYTSEDLTMNRLCQQLLPPLLRAVARRDRIHARLYEHLRAKPAANAAGH